MKELQRKKDLVEERVTSSQKGNKKDKLKEVKELFDLASRGTLPCDGEAIQLVTALTLLSVNQTSEASSMSPFIDL